MRITPLLFFLVLADAALAKTNAHVAPDFSRPQTHLKIADHFADEHDYYRAITEYKKVVFLFPHYEKIDWVHFQIGRMYYEGGRYPQAKHELLPLTESKDDNLKFFAHNYIALSYYENAEFANAERLFEELKTTSAGAPYALDYTIYTGMAAAGKRDFKSAYDRVTNAKKIWQEKTGDSGNLLQYKTFFDSALPLVDKARDLSPKSPYWAIFFSVLFPGGGHFFLREWDTGFVSLSLVGGAAFLAYDGFMRESTVQALIFTTFATGAYIGQIYSSYRTARKYNEELGDMEFRELTRQFRSLNVALQFQTRF